MKRILEVLLVISLFACQTTRNGSRTAERGSKMESTITSDEAARFAHQNLWHETTTIPFVASDYVVKNQGHWTLVCFGAESEPEKCDLIRRAANGSLESYFTLQGSAIAAKDTYLVFANFETSIATPNIMKLQESHKSFAAAPQDAKVAADALRVLLGYSMSRIGGVHLVANSFASGAQTNWRQGYYVDFPKRVSGELPVPSLLKEERIRMVVRGFAGLAPEVCDGNPADMMVDPRDFSTLPGGNSDKSFRYCPWSHSVYAILQWSSGAWQELQFQVPRGPCLSWE